MFQELIASLQNWPFSGDLVIFCFFAAAVGILFMMVLGIYICNKQPEKDEEVPVIPPELADYTFSKKSLWARFYFRAYRCFPIDGCTYFWQSVVLGIWSVTSAVTVLLGVFVVTTSLTLLAIFIYNIALAAPVFIVRVPEFVTKFSMEIWVVCGNLMGFVGNVGSRAYHQPIVYKALWGISVVFLVIIFFRSSAWKITRMKWKALKQRRCPLIRFE